MLSGVNAEHETVLMIAIKTGREKTVNAVAALIGETWLPADQVRCTLSGTRPRRYISVTLGCSLSCGGARSRSGVGGLVDASVRGRLVRVSTGGIVRPIADIGTAYHVGFIAKIERNEGESFLI